MKDKVGNELSVGDIVIYGVKANCNGARGEMKIGTVLEVDNRYVRVNTSYSRMTSQSVRKCSPKFAQMFDDGSIYEI